MSRTAAEAIIQKFDSFEDAYMKRAVEFDRLGRIAGKGFLEEVNKVHQDSKHGFTGYQGTQNPNNKLTVEDVRKIRRLGEMGIRYRVLAKHYGVSTACIGTIVRRQRWADLV
jgi:hypothetical protein